MKEKKAIVIVVGYLCCVGSAMAQPSYSCVGRLTAVEATICNSTRLSQLDTQLDRLYRAGLSGTGDKGGLVQSQRAWMATRNRCGSQHACLVRRYEERIAVLGGADIFGGGVGISQNNYPLETRKQIQVYLNALGHNAGKVDGVLGSGSRRAIQRFQSSQGYQPTGNLTSEQFSSLQRLAGGGAGIFSEPSQTDGQGGALDIFGEPTQPPSSVDSDGVSGLDIFTADEPSSGAEPTDVGDLFNPSSDQGQVEEGGTLDIFVPEEDDGG